MCDFIFFGKVQTHLADFCPELICPSFSFLPELASTQSLTPAHPRAFLTYKSHVVTYNLIQIARAAFISILVQFEIKARQSVHFQHLTLRGTLPLAPWTIRNCRRRHKLPVLFFET